MMMKNLKLKYKLDSRKVKIDKYPTVKKFREAILYIQKCSDVMEDSIEFTCVKCGTWIKLKGHHSWSIWDELKYPLKREAYYYCKECLGKAVNKNENRRKDNPRRD